MRVISKVLLALLALAVVSAPAWAATKEGDKEVSASVSIQNSTATPEGGESTTQSTTTILGSFGVFNTKAVQIGGSALIMQTSAESGGVTTEIGTTFLEGFVKYHFNTEETNVPYVGALLGIATVTVSAEGESEAGSGQEIGAMAGIKFFLNPDFSVNAEYSIRNYTFTVFDTDLTTTTSQILVGFSYYFR